MVRALAHAREPGRRLARASTGNGVRVSAPANPEPTPMKTEPSAVDLLASPPVNLPPPPPPPPEPAPEPAPEPEIPIVNAAPPPVSEVRAVPDFQERMTLFKSMFESGKMSHTMYEVNVARALEGEEPRLT